MIKNIEVNIKNSTGFDILYFKNLLDNNILSDELCTKLELESNATPTMAISKLIESISMIQSGTNNKIEITSGKYFGVNLFGPDNPNSLVFPFSPKLVIVAESWNNPLYKNPVHNLCVFVYDAISSLYITGSSTNTSQKVSWEENKLLWYNSTDDGFQFNASNTQYVYFAIGLNGGY